MQELIEEVSSTRKGIESYFAALRSESDRGHALISISQLENILEAVLSRKFLADNKVSRNLFKRPLKSFAARIDFAYCLGLIDLNIHTELHTLRGIRNEFAHTFTELSFESDVISENVDRLIFSLDRSATTRREKFASSVLSSFMVLVSYATGVTSPAEKNTLEPTVDGMEEIFETLALNLLVMEEVEKTIRELNSEEN